MNKFKDNLISMRHQEGLTQSELAKATKTTQASIARWESGNRVPNMYTLITLADYFRVTVDYLIGRED